MHSINIWSITRCVNYFIIMFQQLDQRSPLTSEIMLLSVEPFNFLKENIICFVFALLTHVQQ